MPHKQLIFNDIRDIGLTLPDVEDGTTPRGIALKVRRKLLTCQAVQRIKLVHRASTAYSRRQPSWQEVMPVNFIAKAKKWEAT